MLLSRGQAGWRGYYSRSKKPQSEKVPFSTHFGAVTPPPGHFPGINDGTKQQID